MSADVAKTIAANMRRLRLASGWTQEEAGRLLGRYGEAWSKANWSARERSVDGSRVSAFRAEDIAALCALFDVTPDVLFGASSQCGECGGASRSFSETFDAGFRAGLDAALSAVRSVHPDSKER